LTLCLTLIVAAHFAPDLAYRLMSIVSKRIYIAGVLENRSDNLVAWIVSPQSFSPQTAMPNTGISAQEAKNLAAYLYAH
jgi:cytochrome c1